MFERVWIYNTWYTHEALMADESFSKYLTMEEARPLRIDAAVGRGKVQKEQRELETNARQWEFATGNKIDPAKYAELPDFKSATAAQKMAILCIQAAIDGN